MPYKKLSEYQCKKLFYKDTYFIQSLNKDSLTINEDGPFVIKVDNGTKHRMNRGLVKINQSKEECINWITERNTNENYIIEKPVKFSGEKYVMIRSNGDYDEILIHEDGGINLDNPEKNAKQILIPLGNTLENTLKLEKELFEFLIKAYYFYCRYHLVFLEMNPVVKVENNYIPLDFAVLMDKDAIYLLDENDQELIQMDYYNEDFLSKEEKIIKQLDEKTGGSLKFSLLNPSGTIWTLIAGGGASVVYTDAIVNRGYASELANYGEYSGDPQEDLVELYTNEVLSCLKKVTKKKTLFIGGGIANFTDVASTFSGIIKSIHSNQEALKDTVVWIRRGGPNYKKGLDNLKKVLDFYKIENYVHGPESPITDIVSKALPIKDLLDNLLNIQSLKTLDFPIREKKVDSLFTGNTKSILYGFHKNAIQRMLDFDFISNKDSGSVVAVVDPRMSKIKKEPFFWGNQTFLLNVYPHLELAIEHHNFDTVISFMSYRASYQTAMHCLQFNSIKKLVLIAEGIPEQFTRKINMEASKKEVLVIGPATVGGIKAGQFRIGNTGGSLENIIDSRLTISGPVAFVTRSGGLLNELCRIVSDNTKGVYQGISIGGDRWPGSQFIDYILAYEKDPKVTMIILLGEIGGIQEILVANAVKEKKITKPIIGWCMGTAAEFLSEDIQFGHAGASATCQYESAVFKNQYMKSNGIIVPPSFEELSKYIKETYLKIDPTYFGSKPVKLNKVINPNRKLPSFYSSISNELGDELLYNQQPISSIVEKGLGNTIGHLWFKKDLPEWFSNYIELVLKITADHGALVSGAQNTIISSRAGKDMISSLCSGLLTIGDYFGGALNKSAKQFLKASKEKWAPKEFIKEMQKTNQLISGIGHKIKTKENPDKRVEILKNYVETHFPSTDFVKYAFNVEELTLQKRNNLILNVDGFIANSMLDAFQSIYKDEEIEEIVNNDFMNAFFVLGRTIGFIGHWYDQIRLKQGLYRGSADQIQYIE